LCCLASLCCITPVLAIVAGTSDLLLLFSWLELVSPYFLGLTILTLSIVWYFKLKLQKQNDCDCETTKKSKLTQSKMFPGIVTVFAGLMIKPYFTTNQNLLSLYDVLLFKILLSLP